MAMETGSIVATAFSGACVNELVYLKGDCFLAGQISEIVLINEIEVIAPDLESSRVFGFG